MKYPPLVSSFLVLLVFTSSWARGACPSRIGSHYLSLCQVHKLCVYPGRKTTIDLPCKISRSTAGPSGDLIIKPTESLPNEIDLWLTTGASLPTNLTLRCGEDIVIFDVIPSRASHTDYYKVEGFTKKGSCGVGANSLIDASWRSVDRKEERSELDKSANHNISKLKLIESSGGVK